MLKSTTAQSKLFRLQAFLLCCIQVMGFSAEHVSGFVAMIGILSMMAQVSR